MKDDADGVKRRIKTAGFSTEDQEELLLVLKAETDYVLEVLGFARGWQGVKEETSRRGNSSPKVIFRKEGDAWYYVAGTSGKMSRLPEAVILSLMIRFDKNIPFLSSEKILEQKGVNVHACVDIVNDMWRAWISRNETMGEMDHKSPAPLKEEPSSSSRNGKKKMKKKYTKVIFNTDEGSETEITISRMKQ